MRRLIGGTKGRLWKCWLIAGCPPRPAPATMSNLHLQYIGKWESKGVKVKVEGLKWERESEKVKVIE